MTSQPEAIAPYGLFRRVTHSLGYAWFFIRRWPVIPVAILALLIISAMFAPLIAPKSPTKAVLTHRNAAPIWNSGWYEEHPKVDYRYILGADYLGRDVLSRVIHGARVSLIVVSVATASSLIVGTTVGLLAGYFGGPVDETIMRIVDLWLGLPYVLIALVVVIILGQSFPVLVALNQYMLAWISSAGSPGQVFGTGKCQKHVSLDVPSKASDQKSCCISNG